MWCRGGHGTPQNLGSTHPSNSTVWLVDETGVLAAGEVLDIARLWLRIVKPTLRNSKHAPETLEGGRRHETLESLGFRVQASRFEVWVLTFGAILWDIVVKS